MWDDLQGLGTISKWALWGMRIGGLVVGISGITELIVSRRMDTLKAEFKNTPPVISVDLLPPLTAGSHIFRLLIESKNLVPFQFKYGIVRQDNTYTESTIWLEWPSFYPTKDNKQIWRDVKIDPRVLVDGYAALLFHYRSVYSHELNDPPNLSGVIKQEYTVSNLGIKKLE
jgi:hypothetical protein